MGSQDLLASASSDKTVRVWKATSSGSYDCANTLTAQDAEVVSVCVHPTNDYLVSAAADGSWAFYDIAAGECLARVTPDEVTPLTCAALHPDGLILGTGNNTAGIKIWEMRTQKSVAAFEGHEGSINAMSFSENGYYLATAAADGVKLWDLRKLKNFKTLEPYAGAKSTAVSGVAFDHSGLFLAVAGADVKVYGVKQDWAVVKEFSDVPKKGAHCVEFGTDAKSLFVGAADHNLRIFG